MNKSLEFIDNFIELLKKEKNLTEKEIIYKYSNGQCETLVLYLFIYNNKKGSRIEIKGLDKDNIEHYHYVYKDQKNHCYDINGEFLSIDDLIIELEFLTCITNIEETKILSSYELEKNEFYIKTTDLINNKLKSLEEIK